MDDIIIELKKPVPYAKKGEIENATFVTLQPPTFKQIDKVAPLKQAFMSAIKELEGVEGTAEPGESEQEITGGQVMAIMYRSQVNMAAVFVHAQELFKNGGALLDGEAKLTVPLLEKMELSDIEKLVGEYIANFIMPSLLDGL
jgi:hypothetical protein